MAAGRKDRAPGVVDIDASPLAALAKRARLTLVWERLWPRLAPLAGVVGLFVAASWFGLFSALPDLLRWGVVGLFGLAVIASLWPLASLRYPTIRDALGRLDRETGLDHRPASALADRLATGPSDPVSRALWEAHLRAARAKAGAIRLGLPSPGLPAVDRYALRMALMLALVVGFFYAGAERMPRLASAFNGPSEVQAEAPARIDAWVTPPSYTRRPPVLLTAERSGAVIAVPQNSILVVRVAGDASAEIIPSGQTGDTQEAGTAPGPASQAIEKRLALKGDAAVTVRRGGRDVAGFRFSIIPDNPPTIAFEGPIKTAARGAMTLTYKIEDDYGVVGAEAEVTLPPKAGARPLYDPPKLPLSVPTGRNRSGVATSTRDVSEHPFAGAQVTMTLVARDDAGNLGRSESQQTALPGRVFVKPLARALVEQRRNLALDAGQKAMVGEALSALMIAPEDFTKDAGVYLGLRTANARLADARTDEQLRGVVDYLWQIALRIEEGDLSDAERALKTAQERLREALERGASPEEIEKLTQELRQALNNFLQEYAERLAQQQRNGEQREGQQADRTVTPESLNEMLDRLQDMAKNGARDQAQQLLSELNDLLENLQSPDQGEMAMDPEMQEMQRSLNEMSEMIQRQQRLRDKTYREGRDEAEQGDNNQEGQGDQAQSQEGDGQGQEGQGQEGQGQEGQGQQGQGQQGQQGQQGSGGRGMKGLRGQQESLRRQLEAMRRRLGEMGVPGGDELARAEQAMRDAEGQLGKGQGDDAVGSQGRALEALRRGAQGMAQQMQQAQQGREGEGQGQGQPGRAQRSGRGPGNGDDRDPLGRPTRSRGYTDGTVKVPGRGETDLQRAARVLEELRRRFSDPSRPRLELDYIERLLQRE